MGNAKSVFISYSSLDGFYVEKLTRMLEKMEISYWKAPDMIPAGSNYAKEIPQAIQNCQVFVLLLSQSSQRSIWVEKEIDSAIYYRKKIIPFQIDDAPLNDMFRFYLNNVQTISYYKGRREAINALKGRLRELLNQGENIDVKKYAAGRTANGNAQKEASSGQQNAGRVQKDTKPGQQNVGRVRKDTKPGQQSAGRVQKEASSGQQNAGRVRKEASSGQQNAGRVRKDTKPGQQSTGRVQNTAKKRTSSRNRAEAFTMNHVPEECQFCGGEVQLVEKGTYRCKECGRDNYDYFQTIRNYLEKTGARSALQIERDTGVPRQVVEHLLKQDYLEIPKLSPVRISCERCGSPIRSGRLCELCMREQRGGGRVSRRKEQWHSSTS